MFQNYLVTAVRNFIKDRQFTLINTLGLSLGLAACVLILLFVRNELSYDRGVSGGENIYKIQATFTPPGRTQPSFNAQGPGRSHDLLQDLVPEVEETVRFLYRTLTVRADETPFFENVMYASSNYLTFFGLGLSEGDAATALADNRSVVLSGSMARKYFGEASPINQILTITTPNGPTDYRVTGVMPDLPSNSHMVLDMVIQFDVREWASQINIAERWVTSNMHVYARLTPDADTAIVENAFLEVIDRFATAEVHSFNVPVDSAIEIVTWQLVNIADVHLYGHPNGSIKPRGSIATVVTFSAVAVLVLLIGIINFTNLTTARALQRAREVSMRKVMGARRAQLIGQFLGESLLLAAVALAIGIAIVETVLPFYNSILGSELTLDFAGDAALLTGVGVLALVAGPLGGLYPALYLSGFRPAVVLKANQSGGNLATSRLRALLVIFQFAVSVGLIAASAVVYMQMQFTQSYDTGFRKDDIVIMRGLNQEPARSAGPALKERMLAHPDITEATLSWSTPSAAVSGGTRGFQQDNPEPVVLSIWKIDMDFFKTFDIRPVAGRTFSPEFGTDYVRDRDTPGYRAGSIILNEAAVVQFGWQNAEAAIGKTIRYLPDFADENSEIEGTVIGIIPDIQWNSIRDVVQPDIFFVDEQQYALLSVHFNTNNLASVVDYIENTWTELVPGTPIIREFLDDNIDAQYQGEVASGQMFAAFAALAIIVSSLGLYGLAAFTAERRTREISIRKVMGAGIGDILRLLVFQFSKPILLANLIAWPVAGLLMISWLEGFVYRIPPLSIVMAGLLASLAALVIAWATVSGHAYRVAKTSPAQALRDE